MLCILYLSLSLVKSIVLILCVVKVLQRCNQPGSSPVPHMNPYGFWHRAQIGWRSSHRLGRWHTLFHHAGSVKTLHISQEIQLATLSLNTTIYADNDASFV